jgi:tetratricopeptide (TPR) repeat protein
MLARQGRYHEAISAFDKAISQDSNFAQAYSNKGAALFGAGYAANTARPGTGDVWYWAALESFDAAIRIDSSQPMPWFNAGFVLRFLGEYDLALECQNVALALDPGFSDARSERNYLLARKAGR